MCLYDRCRIPNVTDWVRLRKLTGPKQCYAFPKYELPSARHEGAGLAENGGGGCGQADQPEAGMRLEEQTAGSMRVTTTHQEMCEQFSGAAESDEETTR